MGTLTFDGVRFALHTNEHEPPRVHGKYAGIEVIIDLYEDGVELSRRKRNTIQRMQNSRMSLMSSTKQPSTVCSSSPSGEQIVLHPAVKNTLEEIEAAIARATQEPEGVIIVSVVYRPEPGLDLFVFTLSDGRRLSIPTGKSASTEGVDS